ncbi:AcrR family transcriptional regulator [Thermocatellispora tengchongensis]|uniref:AcrR family transcriptional regulator n=1 Tax=Thermocatellispora tengchongensis TaxID=1073253 RepID=A0A840P7M0_9ACTN|nr:TetR/AcrR family transcriptional regulator [Thermocatellispora tengchongensis]MBB5133430.1 AcrR family transcriptional regulator [Thermocatellispora tengchongensis]
MDSTIGLRERKKAETRQAVHEAALRLAVERGLDNVTVEAIADAANISRRTFSNYFDGKEDAVLYGDEQRLRELVRRVAEQPPERTAWQALRGALRDFYHDSGSPDRDWVQRSKLVKRHPSLLARQLAGHARLESELSQALAGRPQPHGVEPRVIIAVFLVALRIGTQRWVNEPETGTLLEMMDQVLDQLARPFE